MGGFMMYATKMGSGIMKYIPSLIKIGYVTAPLEESDSSVGIATGYGLDDQEGGSSSSGRAQ
jgi:hypothetical protein